jgi:hypothetical protein
MVRWCRSGPPGAFVRDLRAIWDEPVEGLTSFEIRRTTTF